MKKKILISFLTFMLFAAISILPVFGASATAKVNSTNANRGATVTMTVTLSSSVTVGSGGIEVTYDKNVLELVSGEWNVSGTMLATFDASNCKGAFAYTGGTAISGKVFTATFKVKNNAAFGDSTVKMVLQLKDGSNADISVTNNSGKVTVTCKHSYSKWNSADGNSHTRTCSICQNKETKKHSFSNACDTSCNDCGYTRTTTHNYKTTWSSNGSQHWHECSVCKDKKDVANHTPGAAATETTPQVCTTCQYVLAEAMGHTHSYDSIWSNDANVHWQVCTSCNESSAAEAHSYDNSCDTNCNTCGYERTITHTFGSEFLSDGENHWHLCAVCETPSEKAAHTYENGCDTNCNDCAYIRVTEHTFDAGVINKTPTADTAGEKTYTCTECGDTKIVELEYYVSEAPETGATKPGTSSPSDTQDGGFSIVSMLVGIAIGAAVTTVIFLILKKKKA